MSSKFGHAFVAKIGNKYDLEKVRGLGFRGAFDQNVFKDGPVWVEFETTGPKEAGKYSFTGNWVVSNAKVK